MGNGVCGWGKKRPFVHIFRWERERVNFGYNLHFARHSRVEPGTTIRRWFFGQNREND